MMSHPKETKHGLHLRLNLIAIAVCFCLLNLDTIALGQTNNVHDKDGNIYTVKKLCDGNEWMTTNLKINISGSYGYENAENDRLYGRLYTWKSAQEGCRSLSDGWRLPTNEEWRKMAVCFGGVREDSDDGGKAAYNAMMNGGSATFNAVYGGRRNADGSYARVGDHGFYWTTTESDTTSAWLYNFGKNGKILNRHPDGEKNVALSVRCTKLAEK